MFRVLLVEDHPLYRHIVRDTLRDAFPDIQIVEAPDAGTALREVEARRPDLVFMDVNLKGDSGLELTRRIRTTHPEVVVLILSGHGLPEFREAATRYGACGFIHKDECTPEILCGAVRRHLDIRDDGPEP